MSELKSFKYTTKHFNIPYELEVYPKYEADKVIAHQKYKRCLAMAQWCECKRIDAANYRIPKEKWEFYDKWHKRWLALAEEPTWEKFLQLIHKDGK